MPLLERRNFFCLQIWTTVAATSHAWTVEPAWTPSLTSSSVPVHRDTPARPAILVRHCYSLILLYFDTIIFQFFGQNKATSIFFGEGQPYMRRNWLILSFNFKYPIQKSCSVCIFGSKVLFSLGFLGEPQLLTICVTFVYLFFSKIKPKPTIQYFLTDKKKEWLTNPNVCAS